MVTQQVNKGIFHLFLEIITNGFQLIGLSC